ncbi:MAG: hypothetical protein HYV09_38790 [Deltaproteobacteria bacterium]|nr:hypothetical protein [Deltaproteobacteria bacterium]
MAQTQRLGEAARALDDGMRWPPELVGLVRERVSNHAALAAVADVTIERLLTIVFFASLQSEELERHPIRVAFVGHRSREAIPAAPDAVAAAHYRWRALPFRRATRFDARHLVKLARAASSHRLFSMVALAGDALEIVGIAREGFLTDGSAVVKVVAPSPGTLEVWCGSTRVLAYVRGFVQTPPENVLLAAGPVRRALESFACTEGVSDGYLPAVAGLVRGVAAHGYGGILVVCAERDPALADEEGFVTDADVPLCVLLQHVERDDVASTARESWIGSSPSQDTARTVVRDALRAEIERTVAEIGRLTALDGATILDRSLGVRGFGVVLPIAPRVAVVEALDAEAQHRAEFMLERRGARHHAAASYASSHFGSVVFAASTDGGLACMLRESDASPVLLWRFQPFDVRGAGPRG